MEQRQSTAGTATAPAASKARARVAVFAALLALILAACSGSEKSHYWNMQASGWPYADTLTYVVDSATVADIGIAVRHSTNYEYSNLWVELTYPQADSLRADTFNIVLADDYGRWRGQGIGVGHQYTDTLLRAVALPDSAVLSLRHIMRADTLPGIEQIGLVLNTSD